MGKRAWVPGVVAAVVSVVGAWVLQLVGQAPPLRDIPEKMARMEGVGPLESLIGYKTAYFGPAADIQHLAEWFDRPVIWVQLVAGTVVLPLVVAALTWLAAAGLTRAGWFALLLATWAATVVGGAFGSLAQLVVVGASGRADQFFMAQLGRALDTGATYGAAYGWVPALAALAVCGSRAGEVPSPARIRRRCRPGVRVLRLPVATRRETAADQECPGEQARARRATTAPDLWAREESSHVCGNRRGDQEEDHR